LRAKQVKFKGLVNVSGFHADPGFHGHLIFAVFNAGPASIHVGCGDPWFQLMLADLDNGEHTERSDEFREGRPIIGSEMLGPIRGQFHTLDGLDSRLRQLERDHAVVRWGTALIVGAITTGIVALLVRLAPSAPT
jgi:dCTP deaminase